MCIRDRAEPDLCDRDEDFTSDTCFFRICVDAGCDHCRYVRNADQYFKFILGHYALLIRRRQRLWQNRKKETELHLSLIHIFLTIVLLRRKKKKQMLAEEEDLADEVDRLTEDE